MEPSAKILRSEKGITSVMMAVMLPVIIGFIGLGIDAGNIFMTKIRLQNAADAAALSAISDLDNSGTIVDSVVSENEISLDSLVLKNVMRGVWDATAKTFTPVEDGNAVRVQLGQNVHIYFLRLLGAPEQKLVSAEATANLKAVGAVVRLGATVLDIDVEKGTLLNALLGNMLGTNLHLSAVGWQGLVDAHLDLVRFLNLAKLDLNVGSVDEVLDAKLSVLDILDLMIKALEADSNTAAVELALLKQQILAGSVGPLNMKLNLGDLLQIDTNRGALAKADVNVLSMVAATAELFNHKNAVALTTNVTLPGLLDVDLRVQIIEPPVIKIMQEGSTIHSAAARVYLDASVGSALGGLLTKTALLHVPLYLELGSGDAELTGISTSGVELKTTSSLAKLYIGDIGNNYFFSDSTIDAGDFDKATILDVNLLGLIQLLQADAKSYVDASGGGSTVTVPEESFGETFNVYNQLGGGVGGLVNSLLGEGNLQLDITLLGLGLNLGEVTNNLLGQLSSAILSPLLTALLDPLSMLTGISPGRADVTVYDYAYEAALVN